MQSRSVAALTLAMFVSSSCGGKSPAAVGPAKPSPISDRVLVHQKDLPDGLDMRVSDGRQGPAAFDHAKLAPATPISNADADQLLKRANPIKDDAADQQAFALRPGSQPVPRTGQVIKASFPAPASSLLPPASIDNGKELRVLRYMPEGKVPLAPELTVTFSQPMVAVTSQDDAAAVQPVKLSPTPPGHWRWIGTRTILFDPDVRFPQATTYKVEIPQGTKSANGGVTKAATAFTFETPPPSVKASYPNGGPQHLDVPMYVQFDQKIDPAAVLPHVKVTVNGAPVAIELARDVQDKTLRSIMDSAEKSDQAGRYFAFRATSPFPKDAAIDVEISAGTPSAEGPNKTVAAQHFAFRTFPPLRIEDSGCGGCIPGNGFSIRFNNPLDVDHWDDNELAITPEIPNVKITQSGNYLSIDGMTAAQTTYKVVVAHTVRDDFAQDLGHDETLTFRVGDPQPTFFGPQGMVVLDPAAKQPTLDFFTTNYPNLKVKLYQVEPSDFDAFGLYMRTQWNHDHPPRMPGKKVFDQTIATAAGHNKLVETHLDLAPGLRAGTGHVVAIVEPSPWPHDWNPPRLIAWVQATKLGIDASVDGDDLHAFATDLGTGKPAANVDLEIRPYGLTGKTDDKGIATIALGERSLKGANYLVARRGTDTAFVTEYDGWWNENGSWTKRPHQTALSWYVTDDRRMYKPGEDVTLKGWIRTVDLGKNGDVGGLGGAVSALTYKVYDSRNNQIALGSAPVSVVGGFDTKFTLPKTPNLGYAHVEFVTHGRRVESYSHGFQVQEFRRPEFEVSAHASQGPFLVGGSGDITVDAKYYSGGPLPGADATWYVTAQTTSFTPPNRDEFVFGDWQPWWGYHRWYDDTGGYKPPKTWQLTGKTDALGAHVMHLDFLSINPALPMSVVANASVTDVNRQAWGASQAIIVHPSSLYVGVKAKRPFVEKGQPYNLDVIGVDLDGKAAVGTPIELKAARLDWVYKKGKYQAVRVEPQTCAVVAAKDAVPCTFATPVGGEYEVVATIVDAKGRPNQTKLTFWVSGGETPPAREVKQELVQLIPDKKEYAAGDTAELLVQAPFYPAEAVVSWRRSGIVKLERIALTGPTTTLKVPITEAMVPNLFVQVDLIGMAARTDDHGDPDPKLPKRPAYATGMLDLEVPPTQRTLKVEVAPNAAKVAPGESASIALDVRDAHGRAVPNAEAAVIVVDEAVLALTGAQFTDPIATFYAARGTDTTDHYSQAYVKLAQPNVAMLAQNGVPGQGQAVGGVRFRGGDRDGFAEDERTAMPAAAPAMEAPAPPPPPAKSGAPMDDQTKSKNADPNAQQTTAIAVRSNFNPLAAFSPAVKTGADGRATVSIKVPDNLTRYRIIAIAVAGDKQFGKGESALTARLPLMVRPSPPRFLNFGDTFELPVVVQNQTDKPMTVRLAARATNAKITAGAGREVSVPPNDRVEVRFPAAADMAGTARFQVVGASGAYNDAAELALPVWTPATTEAFATYGTIDNGAIKQPVALPGKVVTQFGGIEVTVASTNLQALTDALLYLVHYPFECAEQRSSRILAIAALRDVLEDFKTKDMPSRAALEKSVADDIEHLAQMQNYDGGYAYWDRGHPSEPYLTVYVTNALVHAKAKGFAVPQHMLDAAKPYLKDIEQHYPGWYPEQVRWAISAYALYTRKQLGDLDLAKGQKLIANGLDKMTMETNGWLLGLFAQEKPVATERAQLVRYIMNHVSETAGAANFTTHYNDGAYLLLASDRRVDGVVLESMIQEQPANDLIPKVVTGLLAHRKAGRWMNTQENSFALLALDLYFHTYEKVTPDFVARVWLGNDYAGDHPFKGRQTDYYQLAIPMKDVATHDKAPLTIEKDGKGRLYYRIGMTYAPASLKLEPADYGFVVERRYEGADNAADVRHEKDGTWHVKAGSRVRVRLTMVNENRRYHVALVDPMPAGLEPMNPALAVTGVIPQDPKQQQAAGPYWWWYGTWYEHQNLRDERVEAFASLLWEGVHEYSYVARATTPGNFVVPPPKAEEMYMPETFGRGGSDRVIVE
ncbi:MAG: alpha-2-macroglobulin family protein [Deltaproteobacteria bacterium]